MPGNCVRCRHSKPWGHRDADSHYWYCEDCWLTFSGRPRKCSLCKLVRPEGHVDLAVDFWYCMPCWGAKRPPAQGQHPPVFMPHNCRIAYPLPGASYLAPGLPQPTSSIRHHRSVSRSRTPRGNSDGGKRRRGNSAELKEGQTKQMKPDPRKEPPKPEPELGDGPFTTVMLRNIPNRLNQETILKEIDTEGFSGQYDFFYLPVDNRHKANVGYAFVNFMDSANMERFMKHFEGFKFQRQNSQKVASVSVARLQGVKENLEQLSKKATLEQMESPCRPLVILNGERVDAVEALKTLS